MTKFKTIICSVVAVGLLIGGMTAIAGEKKNKEAKLEAKAKISKADARKTALAQVPNGTVKAVEIEKEHGKLVWSFEITMPGSKDITEVNVDTNSGKVVGVETETPEDEAREEKGKYRHSMKIMPVAPCLTIGGGRPMS